MNLLFRRKRKDTGVCPATVEEHVRGQEGEDEVCQTCFNWTLQLPPPKDNGPNQILKLDFGDIAASKARGKCRYCHVINQCLKSFDAQLKNENSTVSITGTANKPFFVSWDDAEKGYMSLQVYRLNGK